MKKVKTKRYPYVTVEGADNIQLDRCLAASFSADMLCDTLLNAPKLAKKLGYTRPQLMNRDVNYKRVIEEIAQHMESEYAIYNSLTNAMQSLFQKTETQLKKEEEYKALATEEEQSQCLYEHVIEEMNEGIWDTCEIVCWVRHKPQLHSYIPSLLEQYEQTLQGEEHIEEQEEDEAMEQLDLFPDTSDQNEGPRGSLHEKVTQMKNLILSLEEGLTSMKVNPSYELEEKVNSLTQELLLLKKEEAAREKEFKSKEKEIQQLQRKLEKEKKRAEGEEKKVEQHKKESGELGQKVGELRKEVEAFKKEAAVLQQNVQRLQKEHTAVRAAAEKEEQAKWKSEIAKMKAGYEETIQSMTNENAKLQSMLEELREQLALTIKSEQSIPEEPKQPQEPLLAERKEEDDLADFFDTNEHEPEFV